MYQILTYIIINSQNNSLGQTPYPPWTDEKTEANKINYLSKVLQLVMAALGFEPHCVQFPEKAMATHSSTLAWKIPWTEEPGRLQSMGSRRVGHDWATSLSLFTFMHCRRKWQPTPVFLPGESQGWGSLVGCRLWGHRVGHDWSDLAARREFGGHSDPLLAKPS